MFLNARVASAWKKKENKNKEKKLSVFVLIGCLEITVKSIILYTIAIVRMTKQKNKKKKTKGRQGRSHASRQRAKSTPRAPEAIYRCKDCGQGEEGGYCPLIEDSISGDTICTRSGLVIEGLSSGMGMACNIMNTKPVSPGYKRLTHFQQRIRQLKGIGPQLTDDQITDIWAPILEDPTLEPIAGKKTFQEIIKKLGYKSKLSEHWIQIRIRLNLYPIPNEDLLTDELCERLRMRYLCGMFFIRFSFSFWNCNFSHGYPEMGLVSEKSILTGSKIKNIQWNRRSWRSSTAQKSVSATAA